ncbi:aconitate hydratase AcnA [Silvibacterium dinghuense]|uniref:Aconitate hydratase n=1 Tax=Silvibacterium dinghuense TaxID=1560006 RepID=A0A4Q1SJL4_9BACT|nr:aconitate hydratase AcnA [Silvibacterium dinghuense]RXS97629.1 aconitate hydratase AcnA [Silvibacterium dinghuense]GGH00680.1 aconitate hydratase [Silvibacterium dinghuense]
MSTSKNSFGSQTTLTSGGKTYELYRLGALASKGVNLSRLPYSLRILLENLLRREDGESVTAEDIEFLAKWDPKAEPNREIAFMPARVLMQDFTGVPAIVDLAAMRDAMKLLGGDPQKINPLQPAELVIDHSVQVDEYGTANSYQLNSLLEFQRNRERYAFLKWGQTAFDNFSAVPPGMGICHQVNLEYLARVVFTLAADGKTVAYPDTLVGTDSHTTMINGLGVLGWGVGGIEAEAAMLGQPVSMLVPQVVGFKLTGKLREGATATDLVLTVTEMLRKLGVVGKFVEFYGAGISELSLADRATIANMAPEYGATCGIFPVDAETLRYLRLTGRNGEQIKLVEAYYKEQGLFHTPESPEAEYSATLSLDLATVEPSVAGPKRPQDRVLLRETGASFAKQLPNLLGPNANKNGERQVVRWEGEGGHPAETIDAAQGVHEAGPTVSVKERFKVDVDKYLDNGSIVIAAITSCTNTSNPSVMVAAGILAKKAVEKGLSVPPWVKTSLAPGSRVVTDYYEKAGLLPYLDKLRFNVVGYGCTTCIGNSGPLPTDVSKSIEDHGLVAVSVLSGNRNFEGRINSDVRANYLMSPPLVVAYALAGRIDHDFDAQPIGKGTDGDVFLKDIWPSQQEVADTIASAIDSEIFLKEYSTVSDGDANWQQLKFPTGDVYQWEADSTYIRKAPYFDGMPATPAPVEDIASARVLAVLGDSVTTDHISPAGSIKANGPAGKYLAAHGVKPADFNSYGSRRGNHEVMVRGTFANVRLRNKLAPGTEGGVTRLLPEGEGMSIFDASVIYAERKTPLIVLAGKEYGSGSSRDWAAKGPKLLGVRAVIAESYERIHRSNLVGMGILPLQFAEGQNVESLGLTGEEVFDFPGLKALLDAKFANGRTLKVKATAADGSVKEFEAKVRIDTPQEIGYYEHGGILQYVLRGLAKS